MLPNIETVEELAKIVRGEHAGYRGDRRYNGESFLLRKRSDSPAEAQCLGGALRDRHQEYSNATGLPERTLLQASRVLVGDTCIF